VGKLSEYNIAFKGLKEGNHIYNYHIDNPFFEFFENSLVDEADIDVVITFGKHTTFMSLDLALSGTVRLTCDRCLGFYNQPVHHCGSLFIKFGEDGSIGGDDVIWVHPDEYQINVAQIIYEYICLSIPLKHLHLPTEKGENGCDPEMLKKIEEYSHHETGIQDNRWDQLKKLLNNN
jgi:uncharacterized protein